VSTRFMGMDLAIDGRPQPHAAHEAPLACAVTCA
jgi:hypothetical protein